MKKFFVGLTAVVGVLSIAGNVLLYLRYSSHRPLFEVNSQVIRAKDLDDRLDYLYSKDVLRGMILDDLVMQRAQEVGLVPTDMDVAAARAQIIRTTPQVIDAAQKADPTLHVFDEHLKAELALRNLRIAGVSVTESEARDYYNHHRLSFQLPQQTQTEVVMSDDEVGAQTAEGLLQDGVSPDVISETTGLKVVGINADPVETLPSSISDAVLKLKKGDIKSFSLGSGFVTVQVKSVASAALPNFEEIRPQVELAAKLAKSPTGDSVLERLVASSQIKVESDNYADAVPSYGTDVADADADQ